MSYLSVKYNMTAMTHEETILQVENNKKNNDIKWTSWHLK